MIAKLISAEGILQEKFVLPARSPTPRIICDGRNNIVYELKETGNSYEYHAAPYMYIGDLSGQVLVDDEGGAYE